MTGCLHAGIIYDLEGAGKVDADFAWCSFDASTICSQTFNIVLHLLFWNSRGWVFKNSQQHTEKSVTFYMRSGSDAAGGRFQKYYSAKD